MVGWAIFRIENLGQAFTFIGRLFALDFSTFSIKADTQFHITLIMALLFSFITLFPFGMKLQNLVYYKEHTTSGTTITWCFTIVMFLLCLGLLNAAGFSPFIYFRF